MGHLPTSTTSEQGRGAPLFRVLSLCLATCLLLLTSACGDEGEPVDQAGPNETANEPAEVPPGASGATTAPRPSQVPTATGTQPTASLVGLLSETSEFATLASLLDASAASELDDGPYTVFAPTDEAFAALDVDPATLDDRPERLAELLRMHVVEGRTNLDDLEDGEVLQTLAGGEIEVQTEGDAVTVNGAEIVLPDIEAANGVVHGIGGLVVVLDEVYAG